MTDQNPLNFKIERDEDRGEDTLIQPEVADERLEALRRRLTRATILIPCLFCLLLAFVYLDMKKRFMIAEGSGEEKAQALSKNIESSYSDLSLRFTEIEENVKNSLSALKKETASLKDGLAKANVSIAALDGKKAEKEEIKTAIADMTRQVEAVRKKMEALETSGKNLETSIAKSLQGFSAAMSASAAQISGLKKSVSDLAASAVGKKDLETAMKAEDERRRQEMAGLSEELQQNITETQKMMKIIEKRISSLEKAWSQKPATAPVGTPESPTQTAPQAAPSGEIIEQDIE